MAWGLFFTIVAQVLLGTFVVMILAAVAKVITDKWKEK